MFEWLRFIGEFLYGIITGIGDLFGLMLDAYNTASASFANAPSFLSPIMYLMAAVVLIMWVVNIF